MLDNSQATSRRACAYYHEGCKLHACQVSEGNRLTAQCVLLSLKPILSGKNNEMKLR